MEHTLYDNVSHQQILKPSGTMSTFRVGTLEAAYTREINPTYVNDGGVMSGSIGKMYAELLQWFNWTTVVILIDTSSAAVFGVGANNMETALRRHSARYFRKLIEQLINCLDRDASSTQFSVTFTLHSTTIFIIQYDVQVVG